jgi:hypothetical protein
VIDSRPLGRALLTPAPEICTAGVTENGAESRAEIMNVDLRDWVKSSILWSNSTCHGQTSALTADEPTITWESSSREQAILLERKR